MTNTDEDRIKRVIAGMIPLGAYSKAMVINLIRLVIRMALLAYIKGATVEEIEEFATD